MNSQIANSGKKQKQRDPDFAAAEITMKRAAQKARERARRIGAGVVGSERWSDCRRAADNKRQWVILRWEDDN